MSGISIAKERRPLEVGDVGFDKVLLALADHANFGDLVDAVGEQVRMPQGRRTERVQRGDAALLRRGGGEARKADDVPGGVDGWNAGAIGVIHLDVAALIDGDTGLVQSKFFDHGNATEGKEQVVRLNGEAVLQNYLHVG